MSGVHSDQLLAVKHAVDSVAPAERSGKPKLPENITTGTTLAQLVNEDSWFTLNILKVNTDFLPEDVNDLPTSLLRITSHLRTLECLTSLMTVRNLEFLDAAKSEEHYHVLQVVEQDRKSMPNLQKRKSNNDDKKSDFWRSGGLLFQVI